MVNRKLRVACLSFLLALSARAQGQKPSANGLAPIRQYIAAGWDTLTRSMTDCATVADPKIKVQPVLYLPAGFPVPPAVEKLRNDCNVEIQHLPKPIKQLGEIDTDAIHPHGLLYLQNKYVVPGGRFNEMYGWDSYFIVLGLLRDSRIELARGMVENFFFEIENYGALLNANRTYYLTRSQPPFLSSMVLAVYEAEKQAGHADTAWLAKAYPFLVKDYSMWTRAPHLAGSTDLARYYDFGVAPPAEGLQDEGGFYRDVVSYFMIHPDQADHYLIEQKQGQAGDSHGLSYSIKACDVTTSMARPECGTEHIVRLSADYYKGDRSMRESGFDISFRFGPYGAATHHYAPVCLNSLLFKTERDLEDMSRLLGKNSEAAQWQRLAKERKQSMQKYMWDEQRGLFFDYNFDTAQKSTYRYATTFYPLWAGLASEEQAGAVVKNLKVFEKAGGVAMSTQETEGQWDYPFGWAPIQLLAVEGMRRYGYQLEADRVSTEFLSTVLQNFARDRTIREKYDVVNRSSETN